MVAATLQSGYKSEAAWRCSTKPLLTTTNLRGVLMAGPKRTPLIDRFQSRYVCRLDTGCWEWTGSRHPSGYGKIGAGGRARKNLLAHRASWELHNGPIPEGMFVCHRCDNRKCVNPDHLFLGTHQDNMDDKVAKGRHPRGSSSSSAKLQEPQVMAIKEMLLRHPPRRGNGSNGIQRFLAEWFGVGKQAIGDIHRNRNWAHL